MSPFRGSQTPNEVLWDSPPPPFPGDSTHFRDPGGFTCLGPDTLPLYQTSLGARPSVSYAGFSPFQELQPGPTHGAPLGPGPHLRD